MKVSIIVPIFNAERFLNKCIDSIINQTYKDLEIILVNDCSTDSSLKICKEYEAFDKRVVLISLTKNEGQVSAYKKGIAIATGESIGFVDSDDWISLDMYEKMVREMEKHQADIVACGCKKVYDDKTVNEPSDFSKYKTIYTNSDLVSNSYDVFTPGNPISEIIKFYRWNKLIRKDIVLNNVKYLDKSIQVFEDNCLITPCILDASKICYIKEYLYYYLQRSNSTMHRLNPNIIETNRKVVKIIDEIYKDRGIQHNINSDIIICTLYALNMILKSNERKQFKLRYLNELKIDLRNINGILFYYFNYRIKFTLCLLKYGLFRWLLQLHRIYDREKK